MYKIVFPIIFLLSGCLGESDKVHNLDIPSRVSTSNPDLDVKVTVEEGILNYTHDLDDDSYVSYKTTKILLPIKKVVAIRFQAVDSTYTVQLPELGIEEDLKPRFPRIIQLTSWRSGLVNGVIVPTHGRLEDAENIEIKFLENKELKKQMFSAN